MAHILHKANTRGHAAHGWLESRHTFSFAGYHDPVRIRFGVLRVLNDDIVAPGMGFGRHPHDNMEIISIPLSGALEHHDSMGNKTVIRENDVQIMSAGTGVEHSEMNHHRDREVRFLQIWVFPDRCGYPPRYDQKNFLADSRNNEFQCVVCPEGNGSGVHIRQNAWFHRVDLLPGFSSTYSLKHPGNGLYVFVLEGQTNADGYLLEKRDGLGITDREQIPFLSDSGCSLLLMEVPV
ncbi:MAG: pirin family protein [Bacteroidota bacterium]